MSVIIKGNSALLAFDSSPAWYTGTLGFTGMKNGLFFVQQLQDVELSVSPASTRTRQIGTQDFGVNSINFSPDVVCNLSYITRKDWSNDGLLGMFYSHNGIETSVFSGINSHSFNAYLFFSPEENIDLIDKICSAQSFSGLDVFAIGNGYLTNANLSLRANQLPTSTVSFIASNFVGQSLSGNLLQIPAVNLESGNTGNAATMVLDPAQVCRITGQLPSGSLLETWKSTFVPSFQDSQIPWQELSSSVINSIDVSFSIDRENAYGFGSDYVSSRDVKFPIAGTLTLNGAFTSQKAGDFAELMQAEDSYTITLYNYDPTERYLQSLSNAEISGVYRTTHLTADEYIKINDAKLTNYTMKIGANALLEFSNSFEFGATESNGYKFKRGETNSIDSINFFSHEGHRLISRDGHSLSYDPFIYAFDNDQVVTFLSNDRKILLVPSHSNLPLSHSQNASGEAPPTILTSLTQHASNAVDTRLAVAASISTSMPLYTSYDILGGEEFTRNSSFWAADLDLTCISPWNRDALNQCAGTAITKRHVIFASHYAVSVGNQIVFVTNSNEIVTRTVSARNDLPSTSLYYPDITIITLDTDLPDSITPCKFLPENYENYIPTWVDRIPVLCLDFEERGHVADVTNMSDIYGPSKYLARCSIPVDSKRLEFYEEVISGDSGNPVFMIINDELVLVTTWTYGSAGSGTVLSKHIAAINALLAADGAYSLQFADLSSFSTV